MYHVIMNDPMKTRKVLSYGYHSDNKKQKKYNYLIYFRRYDF
jgi:hypothetical protein